MQKTLLKGQHLNALEIHRKEERENICYFKTGMLFVPQSDAGKEIHGLIQTESMIITRSTTAILRIYLNVDVINNCISQQNKVSYTIMPGKLIGIYKMLFLLRTDERMGTVVCLCASCNYDRALLSINTCWVLHSRIHFHLFTARQTELMALPRPVTARKLCTISNPRHMLANWTVRWN